MALRVVPGEKARAHAYFQNWSRPAQEHEQLFFARICPRSYCDSIHKRVITAFNLLAEPSMPVVVTSCSMTKRRRIASGLSFGEVLAGSLDMVLADWARRCAAAKAIGRADELYGGRNFELSRNAARSTGSSFWVVSAGLGLVSADTLVPAYGATITRNGDDSIIGKIVDHPDPQAWWAALAGQDALARMIMSRGGELALVALPGSYLQMVEADLLELPESALEHIRIFTRARPETVQIRLRRCVMPYDYRLDGPDSTCRGTLADFAGRALLDFCSNVLPMCSDGSLDAHRQVVEHRLAAWRAPARREAVPRQDDARILELIRMHWQRTSGRASSLIRVFRDELKIPCGAARMRRLVDAVSLERQ